MIQPTTCVSDPPPSSSGIAPAQISVAITARLARAVASAPSHSPSRSGSAAIRCVATVVKPSSVSAPKIPTKALVAVHTPKPSGSSVRAVSETVTMLIGMLMARAPTWIPTLVTMWRPPASAAAPAAPPAAGAARAL